MESGRQAVISANRLAFDENLARLRETRVIPWTPFLREHFRSEVFTYGFVIAVLKDRDVERESDAKARRALAREQFFAASDEYNQLAMSAGGLQDPFLRENERVPGTLEFRIQEAADRKVEALRAWVEA